MANRHPIADQFSDEEMERINRFGQALGGVTPFDEEVEERLEMHERAPEASASKMETAQTGGSGLEPFEIKSKKPDRQNMGPLQASPADLIRRPPYSRFKRTAFIWASFLTTLLSRRGLRPGP